MAGAEKLNVKITGNGDSSWMKLWNCTKLSLKELSWIMKITKVIFVIKWWDAI